MAALAALVKKKGYEVVHIHGNSATMAFDLLAVWAGGATVRITHCHNCAHQPALKQATLGRLLNRLVTDPWRVRVRRERCYIPGHSGYLSME